MASGRVLMISHHFPPMAGSGANRALAFARYLPNYGWQPVVVTPDLDWASPRDDALLNEVPADLRVVRTRSFEKKPHAERASAVGGSARQPAPHALKRHLGHLKRFPDAHLGWLPFALAAARRQRFDVAYSTSGPFTSHVVGLLLKRLTGKPWIAELRDGWYRWNRAIFPDYPVWRDGLERRLENAALRTADRVVLVTERMACAFRQQYRDLPAGHFAVVSNGFDPLQFDTSAGVGNAERWSVLHAGALYYGRSLAAFVEAVRSLARADPAFARDFRLELVGSLDAAARAEIERAALGDRVRVRGQVDHRAAIDAMRSADALLLVANTTPGAEATVPGKLFEYLAVGRPVLAVAPPASSTADVLAQTGGGWLAPAGDADAIAGVLRDAYRQRSAPVCISNLERFDRRALTGSLARIFEEVSSR